MKWSEIISEIEYNNSGHDQPPANYAGYFLDSPVVWTDPNSPDITIKKNDSSTIKLGVFHKDVIIAYMALHENHSVYQVGLTATEPKYKQRGFMRLLLNFARQTLGPICSDDQQSDSARDMWQAIFKEPKGLKIVVWNPLTGEKIPVSDVNAEDIWNGKQIPILLIENRREQYPDQLGCGMRDMLFYPVRESQPHLVEWGVDAPDAWWQV